MKRVDVRLDHDHSVDGIWKVSFSPERFVINTTLSGYRWKKLQERCNKEGSVQIINPTYQGCTNDFDDFQSFVDWSRHEVGYADREATGKMWQLDKDLFLKGNKSYNTESCVFVPSRVNSFTVLRTNQRGAFPLGVHRVTNPSTYFVSRCSSGGVSHNLGNYHCPYKAHRAWQIKKVEFGRKMANEFRFSHIKLYEYLNNWVDSVQSDIDKNIETKG